VVGVIGIIGNCCWDFIVAGGWPEPGQKKLGRLVHEGPGGGAANSAAWARHAGADVRLVGQLGWDSEGERIRSMCALHGIDAWWTPPGARTTVGWVALDEHGERTIMVVRPEPDADFVGSCTAQISQALSEVDIAWVVTRSHERRQEYWEATSSARVRATRAEAIDEDEVASGRGWDMVVGSRDDRPLPAPDLLDRLQCGLCIMTQGARGFWIYTADGGWVEHSLPRPIVRDVRSTTGAGDSFLGGLLTGIDRGDPLEDSLALGIDLAAECVASYGTWPVTNP